MVEPSGLPEILTLTAPNAVEQDGQLMSPKLSEKVKEYQSFEGAMWDAFDEAEAGSLAELSEARRLAEYYQLRTSEKLQNAPRDRSLWVNRFNQAGQELYGEIEPDTVRRVVRGELSQLTNETTQSLARDTYSKLAGGAEVETIDDQEEKALLELQNELFARYRPIVETIEAFDEGPFAPVVVRGIFTSIISQLAKEGPEWADWRITNPEGKTMLSVVASKKEIEIPDGRAPVENKQRLLALAMHEIGGHAGRAVNGYKTGDRLMAYNGMPEYIDFEEGLGVLLEYISTGEVPSKIKDRYIDIALATGAVDGYFLTRDALRQLYISREHARSPEEAIDEATITKDALTHIGRIFRGGDGNPVVDDTGEIIAQPVYVKDMVYFTGFEKARRFVLEQLAAGRSAQELLDYLLAGKFDPTNDRHTAYLEQIHGLKKPSSIS